MEENHEILTYQQSLNELIIKTDGSEELKKEPLLLRHVLSFIHKNFNKLNNVLPISDVLPILHHSLRLELQKRESLHLGVYICALMNVKDNNDDDAIQRCLQVLYQMLKTLSADDVQFMQIGDEVFIKLMDILLSQRSTRNNANILACLKLYAQKFNTEIVTNIWASIKDNLNSNEITSNSSRLQILVLFFDEISEQIKDFKHSTEFSKLIQRLLESDQKDQRKSAYYLLKKCHLFMEDQLNSHLDSLQCKDLKRKRNFWTICITNFENLEENQSHLIIPSLEQLKNFKISDLTEQIFLDILYRHILRHNNILVRRWILEYILETITYYSMTENTQAQFMQALNETALYNVEGYMLPTQNLSRFLTCNKSNFFSAFSQIEWKAVPMHFWLTQLKSHWKTVEVEGIAQNELFSLASKIRAMQNVTLRQSNIALFENLFSDVIENMELKSYVQLVEALYNVSDPYYNIEIFQYKIELCSEYELDGDTIFTLRFYKILTNQMTKYSYWFTHLMNTIEMKCDFNGWSTGSLRFLLVFDICASTGIMRFCEATYGINASCIDLETPLNELHERFCQKLAKNDEERRFIVQKVTDSYATLWFQSIRNRQLPSSSSSTEELLNSGSLETVMRLTNALLFYKVIARKLLQSIIERLQDYSKDSGMFSVICDRIMEHCRKASCMKDVLYFGLQILKLYFENVSLFDVVTRYLNADQIPNDLLIKGALMADTKVGDSRIEDAYTCKILRQHEKYSLLRYKYTNLIGQISDNEKKAEILKCLIEKIENINQKKPRYFAYSNEHRSIIHILAVILELLPKMTFEPDITSKLWKYLIEHNNQTNISILYQIALAVAMDRKHLIPKIEEQLQANNCTSSQELSMIVILYRNFKLKSNFDNFEEVQTSINLLWPLTMGAHFQTRLYAQFVILSLLDGYQKAQEKNWLRGNTPDGLIKLGSAIKRTLRQEQIAKLEKDIRFMDLEMDDTFGEVMDFTDAPYDEYNFLIYSRFRETESAEQSTTSEAQRNESVSRNCVVQRKLNPVADFMPRPDLYSYPDCKENMLYVVASLIDKIPNLGGIARTCEVLGIKNLVISSKKHIENPDFHNLSMTAENNLNIIEVTAVDLPNFILERKTEGFKIIGAEQTANSCSFVNFKFPNRSVLLLGHEKGGIPPNLLAFLDYAVEIPQFGMIRSLNVHVTGAIFMWEYCKQHIVESRNSNSNAENISGSSEAV